MMFNPKDGTAKIDLDDLARAAGLLLEAVRNVRDAAELSLSGYEEEFSDNVEALPPKERRALRAQQAERRIVEAARTLGLDLGAKRAGELSLPLCLHQNP